MRKRIVTIILTLSLVLLGCQTQYDNEQSVVNDAINQLSMIEYWQNNNLSDAYEQTASDKEENDKLTSEEAIPEEIVVINSTMEEIEELGLPEEMLAFWLVMNDKKPFIDTDLGGQEFYFSEYHWRCEAEEVLWNDKTILYVYLVDLDQDGKMELIVEPRRPEKTQFFHYEDGQVYSYTQVARGMNGFRENGIYNGSSSASEGGWYRIVEFTSDGYAEEELCYMDDGQYTINGEIVTEEACYSLIDEIVAVPAAEYYKLEGTAQGGILNEVLLGDISETELAMLRGAPIEPLSDEGVEYSLGNEEAQAFRSVLAGETPFISVTDDNQEFYMDEYDAQLGDPEDIDYNKVLYFSVIDLDKDDVKEIVLSRSLGDTQILHYRSGVVYSYMYDDPYEIYIVTQDGICSGYRKDDDIPYYRITSFATDGYTAREVEYQGNPNDNSVRYHFYSEENVDKYIQ